MKLVLILTIVICLYAQTAKSCFDTPGSYDEDDFGNPDAENGKGEGGNEQPPITPDPNADMTDPSEPCQQDGTDGCDDQGDDDDDDGGGVCKYKNSGAAKFKQVDGKLKMGGKKVVGKGARKSKVFAAAMLKPGKDAMIKSPPLDTPMEDDTKFRIYILTSSPDVSFESCCDDACESMSAGKPKKWTKAQFECKKDTAEIAIKCTNDGSEEAACALDLLTVLNPDLKDKDACWVIPPKCKDAEPNTCDPEKAGQEPALN